MTTELVEIQPRELKFTFELKKQSSCLIQLANKSDQYVAFKVKTTSPKKYCVRPNTGVIKPKATSDFTVTMQAQRVAPPDLQCKDKFLVQSTVVPFGTTEKDITSDMFVKDIGKYVEERKLKVVLLSPPQSPVLLPHNGESKQELGNETSLQKDKVLSGVENIPPPHRVSIPEDVNGMNVDDLRVTKDVEGLETAKDADWSLAAKRMESRPAEDAEETKDTGALKLANDFEKLKSKLREMDSNLREAEHTIMKLTEERGAAAREKDALKHELAMVRKTKGVRKIQVGFPFLYVFMVALISLALGYISHP